LCDVNVVDVCKNHVRIIDVFVNTAEVVCSIDWSSQLGDVSVLETVDGQETHAADEGEQDDGAPAVWAATIFGFCKWAPFVTFAEPLVCLQTFICLLLPLFLVQLSTSLGSLGFSFFAAVVLLSGISVLIGRLQERGRLLGLEFLQGLVAGLVAGCLEVMLVGLFLLLL
jgi:hypothetical protein